MKTGIFIAAAALIFAVVTTSVSYSCECGEGTDSVAEEDETAVCPECSSENAIPIIYGKPGQELVEKAERGEVKLGGCVVSRESPYWYCADCETEW